MTMVRPQSVPGEKPLFWVGSAKDELREFPEAVKDEVGTALSVKAPAFWKSSPTTAAILTGPCTR